MFLFFYVDESGHTGGNLFDPDQPVLYYGVLSSRVNVDLLAEPATRQMRALLGVPRLHAAELGNGRLSTIAPHLLSLRRKLDLRFDLYRIRKPDHAVISFFDQVFDCGMNPAVPWHSYWTPLRYVLLLKVAYLFDEPLAQRAWSAQLNLNNTQAEAGLVEVCKSLGERLPVLPDRRSREVIGGALAWTMKNPSAIRYNAQSPEEALAIAPNVVGFQSVMFGVASRVRKLRPRRVELTVDQQSQFNKSQKSLAQFYAKAKRVPLLNGPGLPELDFRGMPDGPIRFASGDESAGLELTDVHLWIFKRFLEGRELAPELHPLIEKQGHRGQTDEISLDGIARRWTKWFEELPEPTDDQLAAGVKLRERWESGRRRALLEAGVLINHDNDEAEQPAAGAAREWHAPERRRSASCVGR